MRKKRVNFYIDEPLVNELRSMDINMSRLVNEMLKSYLETEGLEEDRLRERKEKLNRELKAVESQLKAIHEIKEAEHRKLVPFAEYYREKMQEGRWNTKERWLKDTSEKFNMSPSDLEERLKIVLKSRGKE